MSGEIATDLPAVVLVVDDDGDQRLVLHRLLLNAGATEVVEADQGATALDLVNGRRFDLIVLDIAMPGRSGLDLLPELAAAAPGTPIVMLSNLPFDRFARTARTRGAVGYVEKQVPSHRLVAEICLAATLAAATDRIATARFDADRVAPSAARRFVREHLSRDDADTIATIELLVSELVSNAVQHARSAPRLDILLGRRVIRIEVYDDDRTPPRLRTPDDARPGGRGLLLLDQLASRWGNDDLGSKKRVWFELDR